MESEKRKPDTEPRLHGGRADDRDNEKMTKSRGGRLARPAIRRNGPVRQSPQ